MTYAEAGEAIEEIALGLIDLGIEPGDRVCVLANTRVEWTLVSYGISAAGAIMVPVYPTNAPSECKWVAGNSEARAVICEDEAQRAKFEQIRGELPELKHIIGIERGGRRDGRWTSCASAARAATAASSPSARARSPPTTPTSSSTPRARPDRPRASC